MSSLKLNGSTSGYVEIVPPAVAGNNSVTLPSGSGTLVTGDSGGNLNVSGIVTATSFVIGAGSTASPSLSPTGDSNTGIFFPAADTIAFGEGGAESARFDSSGRLLIGATSSISLGVINSKSQIEFTDYDASQTIKRNSNGDGGPQTIFVKSRGTTNGSNTVVQSGDSMGQFRFYGTDGSAPVEGAAINAQVDGTPGSNDMPGRLVFSTTNDGASSPTARVRLTSQGFLKCSPRVDDATHGAQRVSAYVHEFTCDNNDWVMQMTHTSGSAAESSGLYIKYRSTTPNNSGSQFHYCADATAARFVVTSNGGIQNYSGNNVNLSDEREKKNIVNLDSTWDCLKHWELKKFHYNEDLDTDDLRYGVIAQQVASYCPEVITEWSKQKAADAVLDEEGNEIEPAKEEIVRMGVKEQQMMWMAIKALQEAQSRIETLEAEVAALKNS